MVYNIHSYLNHLQNNIMYYKKISDIGDTIINQVINDMFKYFVRVNYSVSPNRIRFILIAKGNAKLDTLLSRQCNGLIFDIRQHNMGGLTTEIIYVPSPVLTYTYNKSYMEKLVRSGKYKIYEIQDGTRYGLYYDSLASRWVWSSKHSDDISGTVWRETDHQAIIDDVISQYKIMLNELNTHLCYNICITHPTHHPFNEKIKASVISCYDLENKTTTEIYDLPIGKQEPIEFTGELQDLININKQAYKVWEKEGIAHMGFIIRSNKGKKNIMFYSHLFKQIKQCIYYNDLTGETFKDMFTEMDFVILKNYIQKTNFHKLFPVYKEKYELLHSNIETLAADIILMYNGEMVDNLLAQKIYELVSKHFTYKDFSDYPVLMQLICCTKNIEILYPTIFNY